jgi:hypothetical protein
MLWNRILRLFALSVATLNGVRFIDHVLQPSGPETAVRVAVDFICLMLAVAGLRLLLQARDELVFIRQREREAEYDRAIRDSADLVSVGRIRSPWIMWHAVDGPGLVLTTGKRVWLTWWDQLRARLDLVTPYQLQVEHFDREERLLADVREALEAAPYRPFKA